jgi:CHAT domain-containing protein/Tfp pilus assembly protein PilF
MYRVLQQIVNRRLLRVVFVTGLFLALVVGHPFKLGWGESAYGQVTPPAQLVELGLTAYQQGDYLEAISIWRQALSAYPTEALGEQAVVNENLARAHHRIGQFTTALDYWDAAADAYQQTDNSTQFGRVLTEQAQIYAGLGQPRQAVALLCGAEPEDFSSQSEAWSCTEGAYAIAEKAADRVGQAAALGSLAEAYRLMGQYETAQNSLETGLEFVQQHGLIQFEAPLLNSLGNTFARQSLVANRRAEAAALLNVSVAAPLQTEAAEQRQQAVAMLERAIAVAKSQADLGVELQSQLSLLNLQQNSPGSVNDRKGDGPADIDPRQRIGNLITQLPPSRETAYAAITLAKSYQPGRGFDCQQFRDDFATQSWLQTGLQIAETIQDSRAASFALGELGHQAECRRTWDTAAQLTQRAQLAASNALESADSLYLWEWQMGRLYRQQGQVESAVAAYQQAITTLETIRTDILTADRELQFDFRDTVEPVYREYIALLLAPAAPVPDSALVKQNLPMPPAPISETLTTVEALRLAELQNFFGDDCVLEPSADARQRFQQADPQATIITSVVLPEQTVLIVNLPDGTVRTIPAGDTKELEAITADFRRRLKRYTDRVYDSTAAKQLYERLILPLEEDLNRTNTETLVFVQDGFLRNIPMAALFDGQQYLIQRYAIATTPSLDLTAPAPTERGELVALAVGLSQDIVTVSGRNFSSLPSVPVELEAIREQLPGSTVLLDEAFTLDRFSQALEENRYPILHLATHGQFSTVPEETFVITGPNQAGVAEEITFGQLETLIRQSSPGNEYLDLISLTACETATGDDRATLGLAGVAIRSGARTAIASLWKLDDTTAASLTRSFYSNLRDTSLSKAKAVQNAQIASIQADPNGHPGRWAPLILVGNWQ